MSAPLRYLLFGYGTYYPGGGINDLVGVYTTIEAAVADTVRECIDRNTDTDETCAYTIKRFDWWHVYDVQTFTIVKSSSDAP